MTVTPNDNVTGQRTDAELDALNEGWLAAARITDRQVTPVYLRPQDQPGSETWEVGGNE